MEILLPVLLMFCLGIGAALLTALEVLISHLRKYRAQVFAQERPELAKSLHLLADHRAPLLDILVTGGAFLTLSAVVLAFYLISEYAIPAGFPPLPTAFTAIAAGVVFGDLVPKILALTIPSTLLSVVARPLAGALPALLASGRILHDLGNGIASFFLPNSRFNRSVLETSELETLVNMRLEAGVLTEEEAEVIHEILKLGHKTAKDCMTPRLDASFLDADLAPSLIPETLNAIGHRFVPLFHGDRDGVFGILDVRHFLESGATVLSKSTLPPVFVPENAKVLQLFERQLADPEALAVVLDEYGNVEGIITHTDVVEDLFQDVARSSDDQPTIHAIEDGRFLASGSARIDELEELTGIEIPDDGLDTLSGLLFNDAGQIPDRNSHHTIRDLRFTVKKARHNRIEEVLVEILPLKKIPDEPRESQDK